MAPTDQIVCLPAAHGRGDVRAMTAAANTDLFDFKHIVEEAQIGLCITQDDCFCYVNLKYAEIHGYEPADMLGKNYMLTVHLDQRERVAEIRRLRNSGKHHSAYESTNVRSDGSFFASRVSGRAIQYNGKLANIVTVADITEVVQATQQLAWRARVLTGTELLSRSGSFELNLATRCLRLSEGAQVLMGEKIGAREVPYEYLTGRIPEEDRERVQTLWRQAMARKPFETRHALHTVDGRVLQVLHRGVIEIDDSGKPHPIAILQDITQHTHAQNEIERLQNEDPLTGLPSRHLLLRRTADAFELAHREGRAFGLIYVRVPDIGRVHDALGLSAGDTYAHALADRVTQSCRPEDTIAHLGGGEFVVLLDPVAGGDETQALTTATQILSALEAPTTVDATEVFTGASLGISLFPGEATSAAELLEQAHAACSRGESGVNFFTRDAGDQAARRMKLEAGLRRAFERHELRLHYQPQVDLRDGSVVGAEALLRWTSEEFGEVSPAEFVPIAEEMGLIVPLGEWVFRSACEQSVAWDKAGLPPVRVGVNLSPRQLEQPDLSQRLQSVILATGADPRNLGIEVTESVLMRDLESARRTLNELSAIGIEIALDDFGTGYSNMSVLRALPFDVLKIDRSLVHDVTAATEDVSITRAVLMLAQGLKLKVLAEGVETEGQLNLLISNGCDLMQGFIFSKPLPPNELEALLREGKRLPEDFLNRETHQRTLLLVDDEENVLSSLRRLLRSEGYRIVIARSGTEGLAKLAEHDIDVIVSDQRMPGMTGVEFLRRAKELYPETVRIVLSGYTELQTITDAVNEGAIYKFLTKPWDDDRLRAHVAEAFRRKELSDENRRLAAEVRGANLELAQANERQQTLLTRQHEQLSLEACRALNAQDMLEDLPTAVIGIDTEGAIAFANRQARVLMGDNARLLVGFSAEDLLPGGWPEGAHGRIELNGVRYVLSRGPFGERGGPRGELLSIVPDTDPLLEAVP